MARNVYDIHFGIVRYATPFIRGTISIRIAVNSTSPFRASYISKMPLHQGERGSRWNFTKEHLWNDRSQLSNAPYCYTYREWNYR